MVDLVRALGQQEAVGPELRQAARELLLAQASDWQFMITNRTFGDYAAGRVHEHLAAFRELAEAIRTGSISPEMLRLRRARTPLFDDLDVDAFAKA